MSYRLNLLVWVGLSAACCGAFTLASAEENGDLPWALRDHYTFTTGPAALMYSVADAEWEIIHETLGPVIEDGGFEVELADGRILRPADMASGPDDRQRIDTKLGPGTRFSIDLIGPEGVRVRHHVVTQKGRPFFLIQLEVINEGAAPFAVTRVTTADLRAGGIGGLSPATELHLRPLHSAGGPLVYDPAGESILAVFSDEVNAFTLALGLLPRGKGTPAIELDPAEGGWGGRIVSAFEPACVVAPGESVYADPVWVAFAVPQPSQVDMFYAWTQGGEPRREGMQPLPSAWVSVPAGANAAALLETAAAWSGTGIGHALVPDSWEGRHGSLQGQAPQYPRRMSDLADMLEGAGMKAGLSIDPLRAEEAGGDEVVQAENGSHWVRFTTSAGRAHALDRMREVAGWGYGFYVVAPSLIPDDALAAMGATRAEARRAAFDIMAEAAADRPVTAAVAATLPARLGDWLNAAGSTSRLEEYRAQVGPVRLDAEAGAPDADDPLLVAMQLFGGPIELVGVPAAGARTALGALGTRRGLWARPLDIGAAEPRIWLVAPRAASDGPHAGAILAFSGAEPRAEEWFELQLARDVRLFEANGDGLAGSATAESPARGKVALYGLVPDEPRPVLLCADPGDAFDVFEVEEVTWNAAEATLTGRLRARGGASGHAYVVLPPGWAVDRAEVGGRRLREEPHGNLLPLPVSSGGVTGFAITFTR